MASDGQILAKRVVVSADMVERGDSSDAELAVSKGTCGCVSVADVAFEVLAHTLA